MSSMLDNDASAMLDSILREGRNSISEMYKELKSWINDKSTILDTNKDITIEANTDINVIDCNNIDSNDIAIDANADNAIFNITNNDNKSFIISPLSDAHHKDNDGTSNNIDTQNIIQRRLSLLLKWLGNMLKKVTKGQAECTSRYAYVILCGVSSSFLDHYSDTKQIMISDDSKNMLESCLYQLLKYSVSKKKQSLREKDYQQIEKYISRFEKKELFATEKLKKWKDRLQGNDNYKGIEGNKKSKRDVEIDYEIVYKYSPNKDNISEYDFFKACETLNVLCHELKVLLDIELTAFEILNRICLQLNISSNEIPFAAVASLLLSGKICSTHHHHVSLNKILYVYWKYIGDLDASIEYPNQNKRKKNLALRVPNIEKDKTLFVTECVRFEKLALVTLEFEMQISPPTIVGGVLEKFTDAANLQSTVQQSIKSELGQSTYKFSGLSLTADPMIIVVAIYHHICVKSKDKNSLTKVTELVSSLMLSKDEVDEVHDFLNMQKLILSNKYNQLENEADIINLDAIKYKLENGQNIIIDNDVNLNPFLTGNMDIQVKGNSAIDKLINEKSTINKNDIIKDSRTRSRSDHSERKYDIDVNRERQSNRKRSRSRSNSRNRDYSRSSEQVYQRRRSRSRSRTRFQEYAQQHPSRENLFQIFVCCNSSSFVSQNDLETLFSKFGNIINIRMPMGQRYAFVEFETAESMNSVLRASNSALTVGSITLKVEKSKAAQQR